MKVRIATDLLAAIRAEAAASPEAEVCGLLLGRFGRIEDIRPCRNVAAAPARTFEIDPAALIAAHRRARAGGVPILGCYHSHPSGLAEPSAADAAQAEANGWLWIIVAAGVARAWLATRDGERFGRFDEVALPDRPTGCAEPLERR